MSDGRLDQASGMRRLFGRRAAQWSLAITGAGGTTVTLNLASALARQGQRVLIVARQNLDSDVPELKWSFPGSRLNSLDLRRELAAAVTREIGRPIHIIRWLVASTTKHAASATTSVSATRVHMQRRFFLH